MKTFWIIIGLILVIILGVWIFGSHGNTADNGMSTTTDMTSVNNTGSSNNSNDNNTSTSVTQSYSSNGISFNYPYNWNLTDSAHPNPNQPLSEQSWSANSTSTGTLIAKVSAPDNYLPKTNFSEAWFTTGYNSNAKDVASCTAKDAYDTDQGSVTINGVTYRKFSSNDAGAGNFYETTSYRTVQNNKCYAIEYTIHSTNIGNYDPSQGISEFDKSKVTNTLESIVKSFKFI